MKKLILITILLMSAPCTIQAQEIIVDSTDKGLPVLNDELRKTSRRIRSITDNGVEQFETPTADGVLVGDGSVFNTKVLPSCSNATTSKLLYNNSSDAFSCGTDQTATTPNKSEFLVRLTDDTTTPMAWDETGGYDTNGDFASNKFTAPVTGKYIISVALYGGGTGTPLSGQAQNSYHLRKNGSTAIQSASSTILAPGLNGSILTTVNLTVVLSLTAGDYLEVLNDAGAGVRTLNNINISYWSGALIPNAVN